MNVVMVTRGALPRAGGIQEHQQAIARELVSAGHRVRIFAARIDDHPYGRLNSLIGAQAFTSALREGVEVRPFPLGWSKRARLLPAALTGARGIDRALGYHRMREWSLPSVVSALSPGFARAFDGADVVHAMGGEAQAHAAHVAAGRLGLPFVITPFAHPGHWGDDELNLRLYREAEAVIALLPGEAEWLEAQGVRRERVHVIGVPAPEPSLGQAPAEVDDAPLVLCLAVKRRYKYQALLEALPHLPPNVRIAFVGPSTEGWMADRARALADPRVLEAGKVTEAEKWGWLRAATVFCLPSVSEILPVSILEAWQVGKPVVVGEGRWTAGLVDHGVDGLIVGGGPADLADAITTIVADPARGASMGDAGRRKVQERYAASAVAAAHALLYDILARAKGS